MAPIQFPAGDVRRTGDAPPSAAMAGIETRLIARAACEYFPAFAL